MKLTPTDPLFIYKLRGDRMRRCPCGAITRRELCRTCDRKRLRQLRKRDRRQAVKEQP